MRFPYASVIPRLFSIEPTSLSNQYERIGDTFIQLFLLHIPLNFHLVSQVAVATVKCNSVSPKSQFRRARAALSSKTVDTLKEKKMKRFSLVFLAVLCTATALVAQEQTDHKQLMGTICNSACVVPHKGFPTCDLTCTDKTGDVVLVEDSGKVEKIANPKMAMPHMTKRVKVMAATTEKQREDSLRIQRLIETTR